MEKQLKGVCGQHTHIVDRDESGKIVTIETITPDGSIIQIHNSDYYKRYRQNDSKRTRSNANRSRRNK